MRYDLELLESAQEISAAIIHSIKQEMDSLLKKSIPTIRKDIIVLVADALRAEPEYASLLSGTLRAEFGIPNTSSVDNVIQALCNTINIKNDPIVVGRAGLKGGFTLTMMKSDDMGGVLYLDSASVIDNEKGYALPWLEWLLYENNRPIVKNYSVSYTSSSYSRSGMAIMIPDNTNWRVPPEYAGSTRNNWTTRAIDRIDSQIYNTIISNIEKML